ncbi:hypothetical protein [Paraliomyxa miuraensis]|uniref:hypothetical protein n=1 Tax=Paraliomyxa miuraensis TaxID=376150 RepID=UPI002259554C|nr:hypothetical protein [Paraliomyxa miuraensis]MCX4240284.1 hypothetical protein [Paraliomyxa miuraensis]
MKRLVRGLAVAGLFAGCGGDGCRIEQESLIVLNSLAIAADDDECMIDAGSDEILVRGLADASSGYGYTLLPVLRNNLVAQGSGGSNSGVEPSELQLEPDIDITAHFPEEILDRLPADLELSYSLPIATDSLGPGGLYVPQVQLMSAELVEALPAAVPTEGFHDVTFDIVFHATRTGNASGNVGVIDSRLYSFPVRLCNGCLVRSCVCNANDQCEPGSEIYAGNCLGVQDVPPQPFICGAPPASSSSDGGGDSSGSSDSSGPSGTIDGPG